MRTQAASCESVSTRTASEQLPKPSDSDSVSALAVGKRQKVARRGEKMLDELFGGRASEDAFHEHKRVTGAVSLENDATLSRCFKRRFACSMWETARQLDVVEWCGVMPIRQDGLTGASFVYILVRRRVVARCSADSGGVVKRQGAADGESFPKASPASQ